jgi:large subunit ribosomal protein L23
MDAHQTIKHPLATEKSIRLMEAENKLVFVVDKKATKQDIKKAIEELFKAKVVAVNTHNSISGEKRAFVTFSKETPAIDIATSLGIM